MNYNLYLKVRGVCAWWLCPSSWYLLHGYTTQQLPLIYIVTSRTDVLAVSNSVALPRTFCLSGSCPAATVLDSCLFLMAKRYYLSEDGLDWNLVRVKWGICPIKEKINVNFDMGWMQGLLFKGGLKPHHLLFVLTVALCRSWVDAGGVGRPKQLKNHTLYRICHLDA